MKLSAREYLQHILVEAAFLQHTSVGLDKDSFLGDETLKRAFVRSIEIIGEATKQIPDAVRSKHPHVEWRAMAGMRDKLVHGYFGVDYDVVWDAVANKVSALARDVEKILTDKDL